MAIFQNAVTGFNVNIPRRGKKYHVQTEDSGVNNPHIITHLFLGGNIIATTKSSYADIVGEADLASKVRELMDQQHKAMIRDLLNGKYDEKASHSVQLHAPKVDMLTPYQDPIQRPSRRTAEQSAEPLKAVKPSNAVSAVETTTDQAIKPASTGVFHSKSVESTLGQAASEASSTTASAEETFPTAESNLEPSVAEPNVLLDTAPENSLSKNSTAFGENRALDSHSGIVTEASTQQSSDAQIRDELRQENQANPNQVITNQSKIPEVSPRQALMDAMAAYLTKSRTSFGRASPLNAP